MDYSHCGHDKLMRDSKLVSSGCRQHKLTLPTYSGHNKEKDRGKEEGLVEGNWVSIS